MLKKITAIISAMIMTFCAASDAFAVVSNYTEGPRTYNVDLTDYKKLENGSIDENGKLVLNAGGSVEYDFYLPFEASDMIFRCNSDKNENRTVNITYDIGDGKKTASLNNESTSIRDNFTNGGRKKGDAVVKLSCDNGLFVDSITYSKKPKNIAVTAPASLPDGQYKAFDLTPLEDALRTAVVIHPNSSMLMMKGMKKYIDYDDISKKPVIKGGSLYLPIRAFAEALGYYYEDIQDKGYALLRSNSAEFVLKDGNVYKKSGGSGYEQIQNIMFTENGTTWVAVRYLSEMASKKVIYKDGYTFIDDSANIIKSITETELLVELKSIFEQFMQERKGNTYYVAKTGNDSSTGTADAPFLTISRAGEVAEAGDTVIIGEGIYEETLTPNNSGTPSNPIVYKAKDGENVTISAFEWVDIKPTRDEDGLYVYDMGYTLGDGRNMILYNNEVLVEARHPNTNTSKCPFPDELNLSPLWPTRGNIIATYDMTGAISRTDLNQEDDFWKGGTIVSLNGAGWNLGMAKITGSTKGRVDIGQKTTYWWFSGEDSRWDYAYITGCKNAIDVPGEWYWDEDGKLYIMLPEGETPETFKFMTKKRQATVDIADKKYTQLVEINTNGGGMKLNNSEMCVINGGKHEYISHYIYSNDQHYSFIDSEYYTDKNGAPLRGEMGWMIGGRDNAVVNTTIAYSAAAGLYMTGLNTYVANNDIEECGYMSSYVCGIYIVPNFAEDEWEKPRGGHQIIYNTIRKSGRAVIGIASCDTYKVNEYGMWPFLAMDIGYNEFADGSICARDTGTVYFHGATVGDDRAYTSLHNNVIYNTWVAVGEGWNVYWDNWIHNAYMYNNISFANNREEFHVSTDYYIQSPRSFGTSYAVVDNWDNTDLGRIEKNIEDLTAEDYPKNKMFRVGANSYGFTKNYDALDLSQTKYYQVNNAEVGSGAYVAGEFVDLKKNGGYVLFKDVEFSDELNSLEFAYRGDYRNTGDKLEVIVGDSIDTGYKSKFEIKIPSYDNTEVYSQRVIVPDCTSKRHVWIKASSYKSIQIGALTPVKATKKELNDILYAKTVFAEFAEKGGSTGTKTESGKNIIYNTEGAGSYVCYKNVEIPTDVNSILVCASTAGNSSGQVMQIRIGSKDAPTIGEVTINGDSWTEYTENVGKLTRTLAKGTYDIYITYGGDGKSTNAWYFAFQNKSYQTEEEAK